MNGGEIDDIGIGIEQTYALVINDLDNGSQLSGVGAFIEKENSTDLDKARWIEGEAIRKFPLKGFKGL